MHQPPVCLQDAEPLRVKAFILVIVNIRLLEGAIKAFVKGIHLGCIRVLSKPTIQSLFLSCDMPILTRIVLLASWTGRFEPVPIKIRATGPQARYNPVVRRNHVHDFLYI